MTIEFNVDDGGLFPKRCGKIAMQQQEWGFKKCMDCGGELELIIDNPYEEVKQCKDCGRKTLLLKKIRPDLKGDKPPLEKALDLTKNIPYKPYYTDNEAEERVKRLFERKVLNCTDRIRRKGDVE